MMAGNASRHIKYSARSKQEHIENGNIPKYTIEIHC